MLGALVGEDVTSKTSVAFINKLDIVATDQTMLLVRGRLSFQTLEVVRYMIGFQVLFNEMVAVDSTRSCGNCGSRMGF